MPSAHSRSSTACCCLQSVRWHTCPKVRLAEASCFYLAQGQSVMASRLPAPGLVRIASEDGKFRGVGEVRDDRCIAPRRMGAT